ncbi:MAG TPA: hypothetical protein VHO68_03825, partial [Bacteroidales bacterium]|nr:hypothetical protein [Bacteroidales bacterium]
FVFRYFDYIFPFSPESFKFAIERSGRSYSGYSEIIRNMDLGNFSDDEWREFRRNAYVLYEQPVFGNFIQHTLNIINSDDWPFSRTSISHGLLGLKAM